MDSINKADFKEYILQQACWLWACLKTNANNTNDMWEVLRATFVSYCIVFNAEMEEIASLLAEISTAMGGLNMERFSKYMLGYLEV